MAFVVAWKALTLVKPLSVSLQLSSIDICKAYQHVSETMQSVQHVRDNVDSFNSTWFDIAQNKSGAVGADGPTIPRRCGRQRGRDNVPAEEPAEYYKRSITIPFLDHLLSQLQSRFSSDQQLNCCSWFKLGSSNNEGECFYMEKACHGFSYLL